MTHAANKGEQGSIATAIRGRIVAPYTMFFQLLSLLGAVLVLVGYAGLQRGMLRQESLAYGLLNLIGASCLAWVAIVDRRWGFILLEGAWALISIPAVVAALRLRR